MHSAFLFHFLGTKRLLMKSFETISFDFGRVSLSNAKSDIYSRKKARGSARGRADEPGGMHVYLSEMV